SIMISKNSNSHFSRRLCTSPSQRSTIPHHCVCCPQFYFCNELPMGKGRNATVMEHASASGGTLYNCPKSGSAPKLPLPTATATVPAAANCNCQLSSTRRRPQGAKRREAEIANFPGYRTI